MGLGEGLIDTEFPQNTALRKGLLCPSFRGGNRDLERRGLPLSSSEPEGTSLS